MDLIAEFLVELTMAVLRPVAAALYSIGSRIGDGLWEMKAQGLGALVVRARNVTLKLWEWLSEQKRKNPTSFWVLVSAGCHSVLAVAIVFFFSFLIILLFGGEEPLSWPGDWIIIAFSAFVALLATCTVMLPILGVVVVVLAGPAYVAFAIGHRWPVGGGTLLVVEGLLRFAVLRTWVGVDVPLLLSFGVLLFAASPVAFGILSLASWWRSRSRRVANDTE